jgi:hypothetical protein
VNLSTPGLDLVEDAISDGFAAIGWDESMARSCAILGISHGLRGLPGQGTTFPLRRLRSLYEKDFRRYIRGRVDRRIVRFDLGAAGIRSAWW